MVDLFTFLELYARTGGGGSGGDSGGGEVIALIGYFPSYYLGKLVKKLLPRKAELLVSGAFALFASVVLLLIGFVGGFFGTYLMITIVIGIWAGWAAAFFSVWDRLAKRSKAAKSIITQAGSIDSAWNEDALIQHAQHTFLQYQYDWSTGNRESIKTYTSPWFHHHSALMLDALTELGRTNIMADVQIKQCMIVDAYDDQNDDNDTYTVAFEASANDQLVSNDGVLLFADKKPFIEYWKFIRSEKTWLLSSITQHTQDLSAANQSIQNFAHTNHMAYSLDMGWLFLPARGLLATRGSMGKSDINNHVIGRYNERLLQLYTFTPVPIAGRGGSPSWLVMQITLPKSYGGIIVQPNKKVKLGQTHIRPTKSYKKYTFEWPDFNKRYLVHATDADRLATFELINPGFMAYLYDNDPGIGIEVADNVLYLFKPLGNTTTTSVDPLQYIAMLTVAFKAFKELRL